MPADIIAPVVAISAFFMTFVVGMLFVPETKDRDIMTYDH